MKLTIEYLAPYLPYGLKCHKEGMASINVNHHTVDMVLDAINYKNFKIGLRPLSDLGKAIEYNGETEHYMIILTELCFENNYFNGDAAKLTYLTMPSNRRNIIEWPYWLLQKLFEWHFDVFGLIEQGLAIDLNTIQP